MGEDIKFGRGEGRVEEAAMQIKPREVHRFSILVPSCCDL